MDKLQKYEFMQSIEAYLEDNQVHELFENLMKQLIIHRPEQPLDFLMQKLQKQEGRFHYLRDNYSNSQETLPCGTSRQRQKGNSSRIE